MHARERLQHCSTLMLDMDGTLLDLAFDNYMWLERIPAAYAEKRGISEAAAREELYAWFRQKQGHLDWYCLDHWSERLDLDVVGLHRDEEQRISWLPGAEEFLSRVKRSGLRVLLVTNSHPDTLRIKSAVTGVAGHFDGIYSAHAIGHPKEHQDFWSGLAAKEPFDPETTMFVDDTEPVLASARRYGIGHVVRITRPDSTAAARGGSGFPSVEGVRELLD